jgi:hypothetical protein
MLESRESQTVLDDERYVHQANQNKSEGGLKFHTHSKCCRSISCCPLKHHLAMAPKASSTCMPKNTRHITQFLLAHGEIALTNDMLKDYKVGKAYEYFSTCRKTQGR